MCRDDADQRRVAWHAGQGHSSWQKQRSQNATASGQHALAAVLTSLQHNRKRHIMPAFLPSAARAPISASKRVSCVLLASTLFTLPAIGGERHPPAAVARLSTEFSQCKNFFPAGLPPLVPQAPLLRELCYSAFAILHNGQSKTPVFVVERLNRSMIEQANDQRRTKNFFADIRLPSEERAEPSDYQNSGYSRGHMAPAGDMYNHAAMTQSFSLANMAPQDRQLNAGAWNTIEQDTRKYILRAAADVYVFTGPVFVAPSKSIGTGQVHVPRYFFKLVYDGSNGHSWAHWQANEPERQASAPISYEELVKRTGIEFVPR